MNIKLQKKQILPLMFFLVLIGIVGVFFFQENRKDKDKIDNRENSQDFSSDLLVWEEATSSAPWSIRDSHGSVVFKDRMWLFGGIEGGGEFSGNYGDLEHKSDIWVSENGTDWQLVREDAPWRKRRSLAMVVFKNKIWLLGGLVQERYQETKNDVWYSEDGEHWFEAAVAPWSAREGHTVVVFQDKIWVMGGVDFFTKEYKNDVWYSEDGINWIETTPSAPWSPRYDHAVAVLKNKMWLLGGLIRGGATESDIWVSENGTDWQLVNEEAVWPTRHGHTAVTFKDRIWIISGWNSNQDKALRDVWCSEDGENWVEATSFAPWLGREDHTSLVFQDKIWILGGMDTNWVWRNDVWCATTNNN